MGWLIMWRWMSRRRSGPTRKRSRVQWIPKPSERASRFSSKAVLTMSFGPRSSKRLSRPMISATSGRRFTAQRRITSRSSFPESSSIRSSGAKLPILMRSWQYYKKNYSPMSHSAALDRRMYLRTNREQIGERAYLDYSAVTPIDREVLEIMLPYFDRRYGNPSSIHADGRRSRAAIEESRSLIAALIGAKADDIIFTGSGTESDNLALIGCARANRERGNHLIISAIEHKAVLEAARVLSKEGFVVSVL